MSLTIPAFLVNVPAMDPRSAPGLPAAVRLFNPGLPDTPVPGASGPGTPGPITPGPITSGPITSGAVTSGAITPGPITSGAVTPGLGTSGPVTSGSGASGPGAPGQSASGPVAGHARFTPSHLPMDSRTVRAMLAQFAQLARESKSLGDLAAFTSGQFDDFYSGTRFAIQDQLEAAVSGRESAQALRAALSKAQTQLCLAWALENATLELTGLEEKLDGQWAAFEKTLGLDEEQLLDAEAAGLAGGKPDLVPAGPRVPAARVVEAVLTLLAPGPHGHPDAAGNAAPASQSPSAPTREEPDERQGQEAKSARPAVASALDARPGQPSSHAAPEAGLYTADAALADDWAEFGAEFSPAPPELLERLGLTGAHRTARVPGWKLCLMRRADPARPWLDAPVIVLAAGKGE